MRMLRWFPFLVMCCALDLAVPVAPTATGVEVEEDEEVLRVVGLNLPRPSVAASARRDIARAPRVRCRVAGRPGPTGPGAGCPGPRSHAGADPAAAPPPSAEDH